MADQRRLLLVVSDIRSLECGGESTRDNKSKYLLVQERVRGRKG